MISTRKNKSHSVAERLREDIRGGKWPGGSQLPAMRDLAGQFASSVPTVQKAIRLLEEEGLVSCRARLGAFVREADDQKSPKSKEVARHIGLVCTPLRTQPMRPDDWGMHILRAVEEEWIDTGGFYLTRIGAADRDPDRNLKGMAAQIDELSELLAGAILFQSTRPQALAMMEQLDRLGVPWVSINHPTEEVIHNFVSANNLAAGKTAGHCFLANGFEKIVILSTDLTYAVSSMHKATGLIEAYLARRRPISGIEYVRSDIAEEPGGYEAMAAYLKKQRPDAVFATGDLLALGAIRALREAGLSVPEDVSVIGSTGLNAGTYATPALTVVPQPMEAMGRAAARMLMRMIQTGERRLPGRQIDGGLILRDSLKLTDEARRTLTEEGIL
jgi:DNA-binding LacI/PurR family transcriptional regulator/DNA-binding transcriptional regulator YhcF (GntR family)